MLVPDAPSTFYYAESESRNPTWGSCTLLVWVSMLVMQHGEGGRGMEKVVVNQDLNYVMKNVTLGI